MYICVSMCICICHKNAPETNTSTLLHAVHIHSTSHAQQFITRIMLELGLWTLLLHLSVAATTNGHRLAAIVSRQRHVLINATLTEDLAATPAMCLRIGRHVNLMNFC